MDNIWWRIVGVMFLPSIFENRCGDFRRSMWRLSKIDVSPFEDRRLMSRCVDLRRSMCRPSEIDVLTFEDRCVDLQRLMCRPSKIDGRCEIRLLYLLKTLLLYISCMRITPRVCTSVLSLYLCCTQQSVLYIHDRSTYSFKHSLYNSLSLSLSLSLYIYIYIYI